MHCRLLVTFNNENTEIDAVLLTHELHEKFLEQYGGRGHASDEHVDLNWEKVSTDFVGRKWIVVVDYHY